MTLIDTAELHGNEEFIGHVIEGVFLVSKVLPKNATADGVVRTCDASLAHRTQTISISTCCIGESANLSDVVTIFETFRTAGN
jgi:diketogulonate reductase-like aldo/keto reductase